MLLVADRGREVIEHVYPARYDPEKPEATPGEARPAAPAHVIEFAGRSGVATGTGVPARTGSAARWAGATAGMAGFACGAAALSFGAAAISGGADGPQTVHHAQGRALNVGGGEPYTLLALAEAMVRANGGGEFVRREFPADRKRIDIGDFVTDDRRFRALTGWMPRIALEEGLQRSIDYYRRHLGSYV